MANERLEEAQAATRRPAEQAHGLNQSQKSACKAQALERRPVCAGCGGHILERFLLEALGSQWHEDCLKCACCECRLGEVGSSLYLTKTNMILCRRDYLRIFGQQGRCARCKRPIPAYELVMRADRHTYHLDCFACHLCRYRFCVGDKFHLPAEDAIECVLCHSLAADAATPTPTPTPSQEQQRQRQSQHQHLHEQPEVEAEQEPEQEQEPQLELEPEPEAEQAEGPSEQVAATGGQ